MDFLQCIPASHTRIRHDPFLEIPIAITDSIEDLESALKQWIVPENLDGMWSCEQCGEKGILKETQFSLLLASVAALKGMKIASASKFIVFQLKRFTYDPKTWQRTKLNNK